MIINKKEIKEKDKIWNKVFVGFVLVVAVLLLLNEVKILEKRNIESSNMHIKQIQLLEKRVSVTEKRYFRIISTQKFIRSVNKNLTYEIALFYAELIIDETNNYPYLSHDLLSALIAQESRFRSRAQSHAGAKGLGQLTPIAAEFACSKLGLTYSDDIYYNAEMNIKLSAWFFNWCLTRYKDVDIALAYYNGGHWQASRYKSLKKQMNNEKLTKIDEENIERLHKETFNYVPRVNKFIKRFKKINEV